VTLATVVNQYFTTLVFKYITLAKKLPSDKTEGTGEISDLTFDREQSFLKTTYRVQIQTMAKVTNTLQ